MREKKDGEEAGGSSRICEFLELLLVWCTLEFGTLFLVLFFEPGLDFQVSSTLCWRVVLSYRGRMRGGSGLCRCLSQRYSER